MAAAARSYERGVRADAPSRSEATRAKLIAVAERLFAEQGVQAVSLNEINKVAGQRHGSACQYHFGSKDGLIQSILDKHVTAMAKQRAFVRPVAAKLLDPDGGKEFVRLNAQLVAAHTLAMKYWEAAPFSAPLTERLNRMLNLALRKQEIPPHIASRRLIIASVMLFHGLADYSRVLDASDALDEANIHSFTADLEAMMVAALIAPLDLREK